MTINFPLPEGFFSGQAKLTEMVPDNLRSTLNILHAMISAGGGGNAVVWQPGGTAGGVVYDDFATALAALQSSVPGYFFCDDSLGACVFPTGTHDFTGVRIAGARLDGGTVITFPSGCVLNGARWFECADFQHTGNAPVIVDWPTGAPNFDNRMVFRGPNPGSTQLGLGSAPFVEMLASGGLVHIDQAYLMLPITSAIFNLPNAACQLTLQVHGDSGVLDGFATGVAGSTVIPRRVGAGARVDDQNPGLLGSISYPGAGGAAEPRYAARKGVLELPPVTAGGTVDPTVGQVVRIQTTDPVTVRLPSIDSPNALGTRAYGRSIWIKDQSGNPNVTINRIDTSDTIDGAASDNTLAAREAREYTADTGGGPGGDWMLF